MICSLFLQIDPLQNLFLLNYSREVVGMNTDERSFRTMVTMVS